MQGPEQHEQQASPQEQLGSEPGRFKEPSHLALSGDGQLYVVDSGNVRIQKFNLYP